MNEENKYYVYAFLDPRKPGEFNYKNINFQYEPFYIGKGSRLRMISHFCPSEFNRDKNVFKKSKINKILDMGMNVITIKIKEHMNESDALQFEKILIEEIGRYNTGTGPLTNLVEGGRGPTMTEEIKHKLSIAQKERYKTVQHCWLGRKHTEETKAKMKKNHCPHGFKMSDSTKAKISNAVKGSKIQALCNTYIITDPNGNEIIINDGLETFCNDNNLFYPCMREVANGKQKQHKKWKIRKITTTNCGKKRDYICTDPQGTIYEVHGLSEFCRQNNLYHSLMTKVAKGEREHHKGWRCHYKEEP